jgi:hypothetical protein
VLTAIANAIGTEAYAVITIEEHERRKKPGKMAETLKIRQEHSEPIMTAFKAASMRMRI